MDIDALSVELLAGHPDTGAYNIDAEIAAGELNAVNRTTNKTSMTGSEILNAVLKSEFVALTNAEESQFWDIVHLSEVNPFGIESDLMVDIFGGGSTTITSLQTLRKNNVSRAVEIGLGVVRAGHILEARV